MQSSMTFCRTETLLLSNERRQREADAAFLAELRMPGARKRQKKGVSSNSWYFEARKLEALKPEKWRMLRIFHDFSGNSGPDLSNKKGQSRHVETL